MWLNWAGSPARHFHSAYLRPSIFPAIIVPAGRLTRWALFTKRANLNTATVERHKCDCKENENAILALLSTGGFCVMHPLQAGSVCLFLFGEMNTSNHCTWEDVQRSKAAKSNFFKLSLPTQQSAFLVLLITTLSLEDSFSVNQLTNPSSYKGEQPKFSNDHGVRSHS